MKYFEVMFNFFDDGDAENGPHLNYEAFVIEARSKEEAFTKAKEELAKEGEGYNDDSFELVEATEKEYNNYMSYKMDQEAMESDPEFQKFMGEIGSPCDC